MSALLEITENKLHLRSGANAAFGMLFLLVVIVSISNFLLFLPLKQGLFQLLNISAVIIPVVFWFITHKFLSPLSFKITSSLSFLLLFLLWAGMDILNAALSDLLFIVGMLFLIVWHNLQYRGAVWLSLLAVAGMLTGLYFLTDVHLKLMLVYALLFFFSLGLGWFSGVYKPRIISEEISDSYLPANSFPTGEPVEEPEPVIDAEPITELENTPPMVNMTSHSSSHNWEQVLRELHGELKSQSDVDSLFKSMLVFMSGAIELDAAAVGMVQGGNLRKIVEYGLDDLLHKKILNWDNQRLKELFSTRKELVSQQSHLTENSKEEMLYRLDIPIISNEKAIGLVSLFRRHMLFDDYDARLGSGVVFHSMIALRQARLQEEVKRLSAASEGGNKSLLTREQFIEKANKELADLNKPKVFSLLIVEIDKFDAIEERDGHEVSLRLYKLIANTILSILSKEDELGRYGKEGFIVLLHNRELLEAKEIAESIREKIALVKAKSKEGVASSTVSIGLTTVAEQGEDMPSLIRKADMGLFVAKESGCNTVKVSL